ncbi:MAG: LPXTG cell wall anchor domain-containing protein, partial [Pygmaiobacter sp.]
GTPEYDAIVAACTETGSSVWENVYNGDISGNFTMDEHYTYVVKLLYQRETIEKPLPTPTPVPTPTPTPAPIPPPVVPPIVPIPDEKVPLGPVPSNKPVKKKGTYSIKDEDVPLGALPHTSGSRGAAAGSVGALLLVAGTVLHLFKKKEDEE